MKFSVAPPISDVPLIDRLNRQRIGILGSYDFRPSLATTKWVDTDFPQVRRSGILCKEGVGYVFCFSQFGYDD